MYYMEIRWRGERDDDDDDDDDDSIASVRSEREGETWRKERRRGRR